MNDYRQKEIINKTQQIFEGILLIIFGILIYNFTYTSIRINYQYQILDIFYCPNGLIDRSVRTVFFNMLIV